MNRSIVALTEEDVLMCLRTFDFVLERAQLSETESQQITALCQRLAIAHRDRPQLNTAIPYALWGERSVDQITHLIRIVPEDIWDGVMIKAQSRRFECRDCGAKLGDPCWNLTPTLKKPQPMKTVHTSRQDLNRQERQWCIDICLSVDLKDK